MLTENGIILGSEKDEVIFGVGKGRPLGKVFQRVGKRELVELLIIGVAFLLYFLVRGNVVDRTSDAFGRSIQVIQLERNLGIFWEAEIQALILGKKFLIQLFNGIYFWLDFPLIIAVGLWLYFLNRRNYTLIRTAMLASGAISLIIYGLFPVAPPRFLPQWGFVDTMALYSNVSYQAQSLQPFVNPFAAVPSLHFGWAVLLALGLIWATKRVVLRAVAALLPLAQLAAIVFTANHYFFDAIVGLAVGLVGLVIALWLYKWELYLWGRFFPETRNVETA